MKIFFDVLTFLSCAAMLVVLPIEIARFPSKVRQIDFSKNKKNKPIQDYLEDSVLMLEVKLIGITLIFLAVAFIGFLFGSVPKSGSDEPAIADTDTDTGIPVPLIINAVIFIVSLVFLSWYFRFVSSKVIYTEKSDDCLKVRANIKGQHGVGIIIAVIANMVIHFAMITIMVY